MGGPDGRYTKRRADRTVAYEIPGWARRRNGRCSQRHAQNPKVSALAESSDGGLMGNLKDVLFGSTTALAGKRTTASSNHGQKHSPVQLRVD